jgi:hypothetical protein
MAEIMVVVETHRDKELVHGHRRINCHFAPCEGFDVLLEKMARKIDRPKD